LIPERARALTTSNQRIDAETETLLVFDSKRGGDASHIAPTLRSMAHDGSHANAGGQLGLQSGMQVRRLTPRECERLQGFPDDYTLIPYRGKPAADGPRYRALGNSMAVPCMRWIGERIARVHAV
jgi:DNA (cytosine-5)-methyltransferase 1